MKKAALSSNMQKRNRLALFVIERRNVIVEIIASLFILLFLYTAINKSIDPSKTVAAVRKTPFLTAYAGSIAWTVIILEYIAVVLLFLPKTKKMGLYLSAILMAWFTVYIGYMMVFVPDLPCSCGGVLQQLTWTQHLIFNIAFTFLALLGLWLMRKQNITQKENNELPAVVFT